jgi:hypothetical protein
MIAMSRSAGSVELARRLICRSPSTTTEMRRTRPRPFFKLVRASTKGKVSSSSVTDSVNTLVDRRGNGARS